MTALVWALVGVGAGVVVLVILPALTWHTIVNRARRQRGERA